MVKHIDWSNQKPVHGQNQPKSLSVPTHGRHKRSSKLTDMRQGKKNTSTQQQGLAQLRVKMQFESSEIIIITIAIVIAVG